MREGFKPNTSNQVWNHHEVIHTTTRFLLTNEINLLATCGDSTLLEPLLMDVCLSTRDVGGCLFKVRNQRFFVGNSLDFDAFLSQETAKLSFSIFPRSFISFPECLQICISQPCNYNINCHFFLPFFSFNARVVKTRTSKIKQAKNGNPTIFSKYTNFCQIKVDPINSIKLEPNSRIRSISTPHYYSLPSLKGYG